MNDEIQTQILVSQQVVVAELGHIKHLLEKQNGRVAKLEEKHEQTAEKISELEKSAVKNKAYFAGIAAGIGAVAAVGIDKINKLISGVIN